MKGNKIIANATIDDSIASLRFNPAGNIEFNNVVLPAVGAELYGPSGNSSYNVRTRDLQGIWEFRNRTLTCRNASNENLDTLMEIQSLGRSSKTRDSINSTSWNRNNAERKLFPNSRPNL